MDARGESRVKGWRGLVAGVAVALAAFLLDAFDPQLHTGSFRHLPDMRDVRGHDGVPATDSAFHHGDIDDVIVAGLSGQYPDVPGKILTRRLYVTHAQETDQARLPGTSPPPLSQYRGGHRWNHLFGEVARMQGPHPAVVAVRGDQRARIVGDAAHGHGRLCGLAPGGRGRRPTERGTRPREPVSQLGFGQWAVLPLPLRDRLPSRLELEPVGRRLRQPCAEGGPLCPGGLLNSPGQVRGQRYRALLTLSHDTMVAQQVGHVPDSSGRWNAPRSPDTSRMPGRARSLDRRS